MDNFIDQKVKQLLKRMTLQEKVGQLNQKLYGWEAYRKTENGYELTELFKQHVQWGGGIGALYGLFRADPWSKVSFDNGISKEDSYKVTKLIQDYIRENTRLQIPVLFSEECPHGHQALDGELFPTNIGIGSTWNTDLVESIGSSIAEELQYKGANFALVSTLDILRDPRWGRSEECYGEDPYLSAQYTRAMVRGLQGNTKEGYIEDNKVGAVIKVICSHGQSVGGHNSAASNIGERELREIHLPAVKAGAHEGALGSMAAYNEIDGIPCHANKKILNDILRDEFNYNGLVMADGCALDRIFNMSQDRNLSIKMALEAGVDLSLWDDVYTHIEDAVKAGVVQEEQVDKAVYRVLYVKYKLGLFCEKEKKYPYDYHENKELNIQAAKESVILLKNSNNILPLSHEIKNIAVIGPNADAMYNQLGDYTSAQRPNSVSTVYKGIVNKAPKNVNVKYAKGCGVRNLSKEGFEEAIELAKRSDVAILVVGGSSARNFGMKFDKNGAVLEDTYKNEMDCGENVDVANLDLGGVQNDLIKEIIKTGTKTIVILIQGRPHSIEYIKNNCDAILCAWYPGKRGGDAIADLLFGNDSPSGRLSVSIPYSSMQLPIYYNGKENGAKIDYIDMKGTASFPFGFGLSYTKFEYSHLRFNEEKIKISDLKIGRKIKVFVDIKNIGDVESKEVVQLYIKDMEATITRRTKELKAFCKLSILPGEIKTIELELGYEELAIWNYEMDFVVEPGLVKVMVGKNSEDFLEKMLYIKE